jgi:hypothetical protein
MITINFPKPASVKDRPNFYFHATTAYDIVRQCGVEIGKRDFMGTPPAS